tara:strand:- start:4836 stop:5042 length:207 start_codon:yes stop_codon:yes gene_type:complete
MNKSEDNMNKSESNIISNYHQKQWEKFNKTNIKLIITEEAFIPEKVIKPEEEETMYTRRRDRNKLYRK